MSNKKEHAITVTGDQFINTIVNMPVALLGLLEVQSRMQNIEFSEYCRLFWLVNQHQQYIIPIVTAK